MQGTPTLQTEKLAYQLPLFCAMVAPTPTFEHSLGFIFSDIGRLHPKRARGWMQMQKITVGRQAERLLRSGGIERRDCKEDARAYHLFISCKAEPSSKNSPPCATNCAVNTCAAFPAPAATRSLPRCCT
ncbi:MAG: hypothetical protein RIQ93_2899 [Verrucomicrobiota bacterium]